MNLIHKALEIPFVFDLQQRICNDYRQLINVFESELSLPEGIILDVGCSTGACGRTIKEMHSVSYLGIELEQSYAISAKQRYPHGQYAVMDARALALADDTFHAVLFNGVLHHMDDELAKSSMKEAARVLRGDGCILVAEPVFSPGMHLSNFLLRHDRGNFIRTAIGYKNLFRNLSVVRDGYFPFPPHRFFFSVLKIE